MKVLFDYGGRKTKNNNLSFKSELIFDVSKGVFQNGATDELVVDLFSRAVHKITGETHEPLARKLTTLFGCCSINTKTNIFFQFPGYEYIKKMQGIWNRTDIGWLNQHSQLQTDGVSHPPIVEMLHGFLDNFVVGEMPEELQFRIPSKDTYRFFVLTGDEKTLFDRESNLLKQLSRRFESLGRAKYNLRHAHGDFRLFIDKKELSSQYYYEMAKWEQFNFQTSMPLRDSLVKRFELSNLSELEGKFDSE